jgi:gliding motility-associated-like protein
MKVSIINCLIFLNVFMTFAQTSPQVINSAGQERSSPNGSLTLTDNVGETFIQTVSGGNNTITQGYLQDFVLPGVTISVYKTDVTCRGKKDGRISVSLSNVAPSYTISYFWYGTTVCPQNNCNVLDSLSADTINLKVVILKPLGSGGTIKDSILYGPIIILDINPPCDIIIYNGVTANNDGNNDYFFIDNINQYPDNRVTIYNRWGNKLYDKNKYDNKDVRWPEQGDLSTLVSGTYFYVIDLGDNKPIKGWIELLKN